MNTDSLLAGGGLAGLILALGSVGKLALDWWRDKHEFDDKDREQEAVNRAGAVVDAAAANTVILDSLKAVHAENQRLQRKITELEKQSAAKDTKIGNLEDKLAEAQRQIQAIADELADLKSTP